MTRPNAEDRRAFERAMSAIAPLGAADLDRAFALTRVRLLDKGGRFLRAGDEATEVAVVVSGLLREYFALDDGSERTKAFVVEGEASGSLADLLSGKPSRAFITAEAPTRLLVAPYAAMRELARTSPAWAALGRASLERLLLAKAEREWELLALDAEGRYAAFRARYPGIEARALGKHVASYLGITPAHLSRLRARRVKSSRPR